MKTYIDCFPCFFKQCIAACKLIELSEEKTKSIIDKVAAIIPQIKMTATPPEIGAIIHKIIRNETGIPDPYRKIKEQSNKLAQSISPGLRKRISQSANPLLTAVEIAIAGNIIDYGAFSQINIDEEISKILKNEDAHINQESKKYFDFSSFEKALEKCSTLLYLGDNAGEIAFDKILLEVIKKRFPKIKIYFAVRGAPIINDALESDALDLKIHEVAEIINNGSDAPGTILESCSEKFKKIWKQSDLIISKGQGNFESLSEEKSNIYFLLIVKCQVLARDLGCELRDVILYHKK